MPAPLLSLRLYLVLLGDCIEAISAASRPLTRSTSILKLLVPLEVTGLPPLLPLNACGRNMLHQAYTEGLQTRHFFVHLGYPGCMPTISALEGKIYVYCADSLMST